MNKIWIWLAIDTHSREIVGVYVGNRTRRVAARQLWQSLPAVYRQLKCGREPPATLPCQCAVCYTDFWEAYEGVLPNQRHQTVGKDSGKTNYIERFNNTIRQRVGRLVHTTLSFSKKLSNHIGAVWYFVHHYNACLRA